VGDRIRSATPTPRAATAWHGRRRSRELRFRADERAPRKQRDATSETTRAGSPGARAPPTPSAPAAAGLLDARFLAVRDRPSEPTEIRSVPARGGQDVAPRAPDRSSPGGSLEGPAPCVSGSGAWELLEHVDDASVVRAATVTD
jgi:hypothetical protein